MTRKLLSGVLAFAMVFGCTAPVAMAEPTAVEDVEQYANYLPELASTSIKMSKNEAKTVKVNGINENLTVEYKSSYETITAEYDAATQTIKVITNDEFGETGADVVLKFKVTSSDPDDVIVNDTLELTIKRTATAAVVADQVLLDGEVVANNDTYVAPLTVGKPVKFLVQAGTKGSAVAKPYSLTYRITTGGSAFVSVSTADKKDDDGNVIGTEVTLTGLKKTASTDNVKIEFSAKALSTSTTTVATIGVTVANPAEATALTLKTDKAEATVGTKVQAVAQAYTTDEYGDNAPVDGDAGLKWSVNGTAMKDGKTVLELTNTLGNKTATLTLGKNDGVAVFEGLVAGTYRITVTDEAGNLSASKTVTVTNATLKMTGDPYVYDKEGKVTRVAKPVQAGSTVDLSGLKYGIDAYDPLATASTATTHPVSDFGGVVSLEVAGVGNYGKDVAKKVATIKDGVVTVADETNETMTELLKEAGDDVLPIYVKATVKFPDVKDPVEVTTTIVINVTKASDKIDDIIFYADGKEVELDDDWYNSLPVMTVGKTMDIDAKLVDENGFTDGINQNIIWEIQNDDDNDKNVYATVDANGVITPVAKCTGKAYLVAVPVAKPAYAVAFRLFIMDDPTATVAPTEAPTAAPTQAPETKTGTVNTSSSALNIRAAASTGAAVVTKAAKGSSVTILGEENGFYKVQLADGTVGYASKAYIKVTTDTPVVTATATTTANLRLRTSAPSGSVITTMPKGATVTVLEKGATWSKVEYNGKVGYASNDYLTFNTVG